MIAYLRRRLLITIPTLLAISLVIFAVLALAPGDPLGEFALNPAISAEVRAQIRESFGLDQPFFVRYIKWLGAFMRGDMGYSFSTHAPVRDLIAQRLGPTLWIVGTSYALSTAVAVPLGTLAALRPGSRFDRATTALALLGFSLPTFLTGLFFILLFSVRLRWLPFIYDSILRVSDTASLLAHLKQSLMPIAALAIFQLATMMRHVRAAVAEQVHQPYVTAAHARGLRDRLVVWHHILRNALIPVVTLVALGIPTIFTGAIVTEQIFRVPGIGALLIRSIQSSDTPVVMAITFIYAILIVLCNLLADILYGILDPRVRL